MATSLEERLEELMRKREKLSREYRHKPSDEMLDRLVKLDDEIESTAHELTHPIHVERPSEPQ